MPQSLLDSHLLVFKTGALNHSATLPEELFQILSALRWRTKQEEPTQDTPNMCPSCYPAVIPDARALRTTLWKHRHRASACAAHHTKVDTMIARRGDDGRVGGSLRYCGAGTGRWAAMGLQVQNFTRDPGDVDAKIAAILAGDLTGYDEPLGAIADAARGAVCAAPGHRFMIGDFSAVASI